MEDRVLRARCEEIIERMKTELSDSRRCIAAYLLGSFSHDRIWEWSDIQIAVVVDDGYKDKMSYTLIEDGMPVVLNVFLLTAFKRFIGTVNADDHMWKAFSKSRVLFSKDISLDALFEEAFYIGGTDREAEMLLGFSGAVYYLNKAEKNLYVKEDIDNAVYFILQIAENIAWIEIFKNGQVPERELVAQGRRLNADIFDKIWTPLFTGKTEYAVVKEILETCVAYLEEHTEMVYRPVLDHLARYGDLSRFQYETRPHGFGINYEWLVRCGIVQRYGVPEKVPFLKGEAYRLGYRVKEDERVWLHYN